MDYTETVLALFKYAESTFPIDKSSRDFIRIQSARRWAIDELATRILDHPRERPIDILSMFVGQLSCIVYNMQVKKLPDSLIRPYFEATGTLLHLEKYFDEVSR